MFIKCTQQFVAFSLSALLASSVIADDLPLLIAAELDAELAPLCPTDTDSNTAALQQLYAQFDYQPLWQNHDRRSALVQALYGLIDDGLDPVRYLPANGNADSNGDSLYRRLCDEMLASSRYLLALEHLLHGSLPAAVQESYWQHEPEAGPDFADWLREQRQLLAQPLSAVEQARPKQHQYHALRAALRQLRDHTSDWDSLDTGPFLRPGQSS